MHLGCKAWVGGPTGTLFGDGTYSGNIIQDGEVIQPQASYTYTPVAQQTGGTGTAGVNGYTILDRSWSLRQGETVSALKVYGAGAAFTPQLVILRRNAAGNYTNVYKQLASVPAAAGWHTFNLTTEFKVPVDAYTYHIGYYHANVGIYVAAAARAYVAGDMAAGATATFAEDVGHAHMVGAVYKSIIFSDCIVVTGPATVAPDHTTGAASYSCKNLVLDGATASLTASINCKGLVGFVSGQVEFLNGASAIMSGMGKAGNFGDLSPYDLASASISRKLSKSKLSARKALGEGALGGEGYTKTNVKGIGNPGQAATEMQTGGGASGSHLSSNAAVTVGAGGSGGPCCGGAASGGATCYTTPVSGFAASPYGGPASAAVSTATNVSISGASGDPVGAVINSSSGNGNPAPGPGGGILWFITPKATVRPGCVVAADGSRGGNADTTYGVGGSGSGGGNVMFWTKPGGFINQGTVSASGGAPGTDGYGGVAGTAGGLGSVNIYQDAV